MRQAFWQGILKLYVLHQIEKCPSYGGKLKKHLHDLGYEISPGSLYPLLHELEKAAYLKSRVKIFKGRTRKYYEITDPGRVCLGEMREEMSAILEDLLL